MTEELRSSVRKLLYMATSTTKLTLSINSFGTFFARRSAIFHDFASGFNFMRDVSKMSSKPVSVRLVDNKQFRLSQVMKGGGGGIKSTLKVSE